MFSLLTIPPFVISLMPRSTLFSIHFLHLSFPPPPYFLSSLFKSPSSFLSHFSPSHFIPPSVTLLFNAPSLTHFYPSPSLLSSSHTMPPPFYLLLSSPSDSCSLATELTSPWRLCVCVCLCLTVCWCLTQRHLY